MGKTRPFLRRPALFSIVAAAVLFCVGADDGFFLLLAATAAAAAAASALCSSQLTLSINQGGEILLFLPTILRRRHRL